jgi:pyrroloquinoline quinone (PQQ) biosynthesis protein C
MYACHIAELREKAGAALDRIERHRFVALANEGRLSRSQAHRWVMCAGRESRSFPSVLANMIKHVTDPLARKVLEENLDDEYGNGNPAEAHFQHYLQLLPAVGLSEVDFHNYVEGPGVALALRLAEAVSRRANAAIALGYMLVNEGMTPIIYGAVERAIFELQPCLKTQFFRLHVEVDEQHVAELYRAAEAFSEHDMSDMAHGIDLGERGMAVLLDEALGVFSG